MADIMPQDSISIDSSDVTTPDVLRQPPSSSSLHESPLQNHEESPHQYHDNHSSRVTSSSLTDDLVGPDGQSLQSNPPSPGVFDPGTMMPNVKSPSEENIRIEDRIEATFTESMGKCEMCKC